MLNSKITAIPYILDCNWVGVDYLAFLERLLLGDIVEDVAVSERSRVMRDTTKSPYLNGKLLRHSLSLKI